MATSYETITITVPTWAVPHMLQVAADLAHASDPDKGMAPDEIRTQYRRGNSDLWRPFIRFMADRPDQWIRAEILRIHLKNMTGRELTKDGIGGMLGGVFRGYMGPKIYETEMVDGERCYRVTRHVADALRGI